MGYAFPSVAISGYYYREPKEKKNTIMLLQGMGMTMLGLAANNYATIRSGIITKDSLFGASLMSFFWGADQVKNLFTGDYDAVGIKKESFYFWIPVNFGLGALALLAWNEKCY